MRIDDDAILRIALQARDAAAEPCIRAKANNNANNNANNINCSDVKNKKRDECLRVKANTNDRNMNDVDCSKAKDADVRQACRKET